jgi:DNA polymerase-3 subunit beta
MPSVIVPRKAVSELRKLIEESAEQVQISLSESKIRFVSGSVTLVSKLIDGTFPDYERVIPTANSKLLEIESKAFSQAIDRVSTISTEKTRGIKLNVNKGSISLAASSPENGTATEEVPATYSADAVEIGFNSRYLLEVLSQLEGDTAQVLLSDGASPALVRDPADATALYVVMPMRI